MPGAGRLRRMNAAATSCSPQAAARPPNSMPPSTAAPPSKASPTPTSTSSWPQHQQSRSLGGVHRRDITASALPVTVIKTAPWSATRNPAASTTSTTGPSSWKPSSTRRQSTRTALLPSAVAVILGAQDHQCPAIINGPDLGYDIRLAYPAQITPGGDAYQTIADFLTTWLTATRDHPAAAISAATAPHRQSNRSNTRLSPRFRCNQFSPRQISLPTPATEPNQNPRHRKRKADDRTEQTLTYPLTLTRQSNKWFISDIDRPETVRPHHESTPPKPRPPH
ncbi:hypothetical protein I553_3861 [Mycobacterium xenopi 4042]|uniref:Uncharacterized protein n=1 Tax=Mycobacterium xenopi 4042 TaxID=1299334 RepID=X8AQI6_MYCXE|nr:hypothetical protein I553_3861 [Mycobacterium xenopi 4042]